VFCWSNENVKVFVNVCLTVYIAEELILAHLDSHSHTKTSNAEGLIQRPYTHDI